MPKVNHRGYVLEVSRAPDVPRTIAVRIRGDGLHDGVDVLTTHEFFPQTHVNVSDAESAAIEAAQRYVDRILVGPAREVKIADKDLRQFHAMIARNEFELQDFDVKCHVDDLRKRTKLGDLEHVYTVIYRPLKTAWLFRDEGDGLWVKDVEWYLNTIRFIRND